MLQLILPFHLRYSAFLPQSTKDGVDNRKKDTENEGPPKTIQMESGNQPGGQHHKNSIDDKQK